jgi:hypothetical protein
MGVIFLVTLPLPFYWQISFLFTVTYDYHCRLTANFVSCCVLQNGGRKVSIFIKRMSVAVFPTIWKEELLEQKKMGIKKRLYLAEKARGKTN